MKDFNYEKGGKMITGISIKCEVAKGIFASEYFVRIKTLNGDLWEGSVDKEMVFDLEEEPGENEYKKGRMYAYLIAFDNDSALIELPIEYSAAGRRIKASVDSLRKEKVPA